MNLIEQSVERITKESFRNFYDREQAEEELMDMLQSNRLFKMNDITLDFIKKLTGQSGHSSDSSLGKNALEGMNRVISELNSWRSQLQKRYQNKT